MSKGNISELTEEELKITKKWIGDINIPLLSITCTTYNHEKYIKDTIEGFLIQETTFPFEIIIHDDASTDQTQSIIKDYHERYPNIIIPILQKENHWQGKGINATTTIVWPSSKGKYIAWCEGDDYWTDPLKLQKQVDFLEINLEYVLTFHKIKIVKPDGSFTDDTITNVPENYEIQETLARLGNYIHTPSVVFRNCITVFPDEFNLSPSCDYFLYMLLSNYGKLKYFKDEMAVYREGVGIWSTKSYYFRNLNTAFVYSLLIKVFDEKGQEVIVNIFVDRLKSFLNIFKDQISSEDLLKLSHSRIVSSTISEWNQKSALERKDGRAKIQLIKALLKKIKNKVWKK